MTQVPDDKKIPKTSKGSLHNPAMAIHGRMIEQQLAAYVNTPLARKTISEVDFVRYCLPVFVTEFPEKNVEVDLWGSRFGLHEWTDVLDATNKVVCSIPPLLALENVSLRTLPDNLGFTINDVLNYVNSEAQMGFNSGLVAYNKVMKPMFNVEIRPEFAKAWNVIYKRYGIKKHYSLPDDPAPASTTPVAAAVTNKAPPEEGIEEYDELF